MRSLRGRLALGVLIVLAVVLGTAAFAIDRQMSSVEERVFDDRLQRTAALSRATATKAVLESLPDSDERLDAVLRAGGSSLRIVVAGRVLLASGAALPAGAPRRHPLGLSTFTARSGRTYRVLTTHLGEKSLGRFARLEVIASMAEIDDRRGERRRWLIAVFAGTLIVVGLGTLLAARVVLLPLERLRDAAARIAAERDLRLRVADEHHGPAETSALARSFNAMLARLESSAADRERALQATRRFTADAGHELRTPMTSISMTLQLLGRSDLDDRRRAEMAGEALEQQRRLVALLDGLSTLARGEVAPLELSEVDLGDVIDQLAAELRGSDPTATIELHLPDEPLLVAGWEPGLRLMIGNIMRNAIVHGGRPAAVRVELTREQGSGGAEAQVVVEDNGPGIPAEDRARVFEPFVRIVADGPPGSGLGLPLVAQQAEQHGADVAIGDGVHLPGARFCVRLPVRERP